MGDAEDIQDEVMGALEEAGVEATLMKVGPGAYSTSTGMAAPGTDDETTTITAVIMAVNRRDVDGQRVLATDFQCIIGGQDLDFPPQADHLIVVTDADTLAETTYAVIATKKYEVSGVVMAYICQVRNVSNVQR